MSAPTPASDAGTNPLQGLAQYGQSAWLDYIRRSLITSGDLQRMVDQDNLGGMTSNPAIFEKAITGSNDYADILQELQQDGSLDPVEIYEHIAIQDIQDAADILRPVYDRTNRRDGYVSLEVSPFLARDCEGTIREARRLWTAVDRPNLMIKIPATPEAIPAIELAISEGINVNVTLLFAQSVYEQVARAYIAGLGKWAAAGGDVGRVASVASFFISRIDSMVDAKVKALLQETIDESQRVQLSSLLGKVAIANAKLTYQAYKELFAGDTWNALASAGAQTQRLLWASTGTKDPSYSDVLYVNELIGADTVNTIPPATWDAFRDHGTPQPTLEANVDAAQSVMAMLAQVGISMQTVTDDLLTQAVRLFAEPFDKLLNAVDERCSYVAVDDIPTLSHSLPAPIQQSLEDALDDWKMTGKVRRLWARDASLWTGKDENRWLGWLSITEEQLDASDDLMDFGNEIQDCDYQHILLLGMGGSSLCPEVFKMTFGHIDGFPELLVLDSTDPAQIKAFERRIDLARTLFIVSSKSGSTLEPNIFKQYFYERVRSVVGDDEVGERFIAVTDPGSHLEQAAQAEHFRDIFPGVPSIGGRYSALSNFGMVPAAAMGLDVPRLLDLADEMAITCSPCLPLERNPGVALGLLLGACARHGRDKVTLVTSPAIHDLGAWLEQLIAESTGKEGKALIPVDREALASPAAYGNDRVFVYIRTEEGFDTTQDQHVDAFEQAGHPVVRIALSDVYDIGAEMYRWQIATAVACSELGVSAFDQPDVEASKIATKALTSEYERTGSLPAETPIFTEGGIQLYTDDVNATALATAERSLVGYLRAHLNRLQSGDYFGLLAYVHMNEANESTLQAIRTQVRDTRQTATCLGFGPRFLHSTGQAYKGGPNTGVFLQITTDDAEDLAVPGQTYTFGVVKAAQARGDFQVLVERQRRALRVHLHEPAGDLEILRNAITQALQ
jgi:transaldolase / glucose-6-phosphate isomerase